MKIRNISRVRSIELVYPNNVIYLVPGQVVEVDSEPLNYEVIKDGISVENVPSEIEVISEVRRYEPAQDLTEVKAPLQELEDLSEDKEKKVVKRRRRKEKKE